MYDSEIITLPDTGTLDECWNALGFPRRDNYGNPLVDGVYRRLAAATGSIWRRGAVARELQFGSTNSVGMTPFIWESEGGVWTSRHWRVTGYTWLLPDGTVEAQDVTIAVKSSAAAEVGRVEWTAFRGSALADFIGTRLGQVLMLFGARALADGNVDDPSLERVSLTDEEREEYHNLHPSPWAAWIYEGQQRVVLIDDDYARGWVRGNVSAVACTLRRLGWGQIDVVENLDQSVPQSDDPDAGSESVLTETTAPVDPTLVSTTPIDERPLAEWEIELLTPTSSPEGNDS